MHGVLISTPQNKDCQGLYIHVHAQSVGVGCASVEILYTTYMYIHVVYQLPEYICHAIWLINPITPFLTHPVTPSSLMDRSFLGLPTPQRDAHWQVGIPVSESVRTVASAGGPCTQCAVHLSRLMQHLSAALSLLPHSQRTGPSLSRWERAYFFTKEGLLCVHSAQKVLLARLAPVWMAMSVVG